jgi:protein arginine N-methyltransferase 1
VDIGTGTGILALLACRFGARQVYAIEPSDAIQVGRECAAANECADRIHWIQNVSTRVTLPEPADVVVSDLRGCLPLHGHNLTAIVDARRRLLAPGGLMIPQEDTLWLCPVESPESYRPYTTPWLENAFELDMRAGHRLVINTWGKGRVPKEHFLASPVCWATLDYRSVESLNVCGTVSCVASRAGTAHGMSVWFETTLADRIGFSTAPDLPELVYGNAFFPWSEPVALAAGDTMTIALHADLVGDEYIWRWKTDVLNQGDPYHPKARFRQSTFLGAPLSPTQLRKRAANFRPRLNEDGRIVKRVLDMMTSNTLQDIAAHLVDEFPERFTQHADALARVGELSVKYGESSERSASVRE